MEKLKHPGPYCIKCKKPLGYPHPHTKNRWVSAIIGNEEKSFCQCYKCMVEEMKRVVAKFKATLNNEQLYMFENFAEILVNAFDYKDLQSDKSREFFYK